MAAHVLAVATCVLALVTVCSQVQAQSPNSPVSNWLTAQDSPSPPKAQSPTSELAPAIAAVANGKGHTVALSVMVGVVVAVGCVAVCITAALVAVILCCCYYDATGSLLDRIVPTKIQQKIRQRQQHWQQHQWPEPRSQRWPQPGVRRADAASCTSFTDGLLHGRAGAAGAGTAGGGGGGDQGGGAGGHRQGKTAIPLTPAGLLLAKRAKPPGSYPALFGQEVTLVATDVEGSTELWEWQPEVMNAALALHDRAMRLTLAACAGYEVTTEGDAFLVAFHDPVDAVRWALLLQSTLLQIDWPPLLLEHPLCRPRPLLPIAPVQTSSRHESGSVFKSGSGILAAHTAVSGRKGSSSRSSCGGAPLLVLFKGLSVRVGIATGVPSAVREHPVTRRMQYTGAVLRLATGIAELGSGGQVLLEPLTFKGIHNKFEELDVEEGEVHEMADAVNRTAARDFLDRPTAFTNPSASRHTLAPSTSAVAPSATTTTTPAADVARNGSSSPSEPPPPVSQLSWTTRSTAPQPTPLEQQQQLPLPAQGSALTCSATSQSFARCPGSVIHSHYPGSCPHPGAQAPSLSSSQNPKQLLSAATSPASSPPPQQPLPPSQSTPRAIRRPALVEVASLPSPIPAPAMAGAAAADTGESGAAATASEVVSTVSPFLTGAAAMEAGGSSAGGSGMRGLKGGSSAVIVIGGASAASDVVAAHFRSGGALLSRVSRLGPAAAAITTVTVTPQQQLPVASSAANVPQHVSSQDFSLSSGASAMGTQAAALQLNPLPCLGGSAERAATGSGGGGQQRAEAVGVQPGASMTQSRRFLPVAGWKPLGPSAVELAMLLGSAASMESFGPRPPSQAAGVRGGIRGSGESGGGAYIMPSSNLQTIFLRTLTASPLDAAAFYEAQQPYQHYAQQQLEELRLPHPEPGSRVAASAFATAPASTAAATTYADAAAAVAATKAFVASGQYAKPYNSINSPLYNMHHLAAAVASTSDHYTAVSLEGGMAGLMNYTGAGGHALGSNGGGGGGADGSRSGRGLGLPSVASGGSGWWVAAAADGVAAANGSGVAGSNIDVSLGRRGRTDAEVASNPGPIGEALEDENKGEEGREVNVQETASRDDAVAAPAAAAAKASVSSTAVAAAPEHADTAAKSGTAAASAAGPDPIAEDERTSAAADGGGGGVNQSAQQQPEGVTGQQLGAVAAAAAAPGDTATLANTAAGSDGDEAIVDILMNTVGSSGHQVWGPNAATASDWQTCSLSFGQMPIASPGAARGQQRPASLLPKQQSRLGGGSSGLSATVVGNAGTAAMPVPMGPTVEAASGTAVNPSPTPQPRAQDQPHRSAATRRERSDHSSRASAAYMAAPPASPEAIPEAYTPATATLLVAEGSTRYQVAGWTSVQGGNLYAATSSLKPTSFDIAAAAAAAAPAPALACQLGGQRDAEGTDGALGVGPGLSMSVPLPVRGQGPQATGFGGGGGAGTGSNGGEAGMLDAGVRQPLLSMPEMDPLGRPTFGRARASQHCRFSPFGLFPAAAAAAAAAGIPAAGTAGAGASAATAPVDAYPWGAPGSTLHWQLPGRVVGLHGALHGGVAGGTRAAGLPGGAPPWAHGGGPGSAGSLQGASASPFVDPGSTLPLPQVPQWWPGGGGGAAEGEGAFGDRLTAGAACKQVLALRSAMAMEAMGTLANSTAKQARDMAWEDAEEEADTLAAGLGTGDPAPPEPASSSRLGAGLWQVEGTPAPIAQLTSRDGQGAGAGNYQRGEKGHEQINTSHDPARFQSLLPAFQHSTASSSALSAGHTQPLPTRRSSHVASDARDGRLSSAGLPQRLPSAGLLARVRKRAVSYTSRMATLVGSGRTALLSKPGSSGDGCGRLRSTADTAQQGTSHGLAAAEEGAGFVGEWPAGAGAAGTAGTSAAAASGMTGVAAAADTAKTEALDAAEAHVAAPDGRAGAGGGGGGDAGRMVTRLGSKAVLMRSLTRQLERIRRMPQRGPPGGNRLQRSPEQHSRSSPAGAAAAHGTSAAAAAAAAAGRAATADGYANNSGGGDGCGRRGAAATAEGGAARREAGGGGGGGGGGGSHALVVVDMGVHRLNVPAVGAAYGDVYDGVQVIQLLPADLQHRAAYHPPLKSQAQLAPGFFDAPGASQALQPCTPGQSPSFPRLSLMFIQPAGYTAVANSQQDVAERSGAVFCAAVREVMQMYGAYECQEYECTFMVACRDPRVAAEAALALHEWLLHAAWPADLLELPEGREVLGPEGQPIMRGFRAKAGIFTGVPLAVVPHATTGRADYFGAMVNRAARLMAGAKAGQILLDKPAGLQVLGQWRLLEAEAAAAAAVTGAQPPGSGGGFSSAPPPLQPLQQPLQQQQPATPPPAGATAEAPPWQGCAANGTLPGPGNETGAAAATQCRRATTAAAVRQPLDPAPEAASLPVLPSPGALLTSLTSSGGSRTSSQPTASSHATATAAATTSLPTAAAAAAAAGLDRATSNAAYSGSFPATTAAAAASGYGGSFLTYSHSVPQQYLHRHHHYRVYPQRQLQQQLLSAPLCRPALAAADGSIASGSGGIGGGWPAASSIASLTQQGALPYRHSTQDAAVLAALTARSTMAKPAAAVPLTVQVLDMGMYKFKGLKEPQPVVCVQLGRAAPSPNLQEQQSQQQPQQSAQAVGSSQQMKETGPGSVGATEKGPGLVAAPGFEAGAAGSSSKAAVMQAGTGLIGEVLVALPSPRIRP